MKRVGLGEDTVFATKPELAARMIGRFLDAGHRVGWVAGDEVYGGNPKLRSALEERKVGYVLAVASSTPDRWPSGGLPGTLIWRDPRVTPCNGWIAALSARICREADVALDAVGSPGPRALPSSCTTAIGTTSAPAGCRSRNGSAAADTAVDPSGHRAP